MSMQHSGTRRKGNARRYGGVWGALLLALPCATLTLGCSKKPEPAPATKSEKQAQKKAPAAAEKKKEVSKAPPPNALGPMRMPADNPQTDEKVALGRRLFFDKRMSVDGSKACFDCHLNEDGTGGHDPLALAIDGKPMSRHAPMLWNVGYLPKLYWDGRADSLEAVVKGAWGGAGMGIGADNLGKKAAEIGALKEYADDFERIFPELGATPETIARAIASYQRTLVCGDTKYDRFAAGNGSVISPEAKQGWELFKGKAGCTNCHVPPFFSDAYLGDSGAFHNTGMGTQGKAEKDVDPGRMKVSENPAEWAAFKTPSLRNIAKTAPYFHNGSVATLKEAVQFMAGGGAKNKKLDPRLVDRKLSEAEIDMLVAFLQTLDCKGELEPPGQ